jgi:hypothetical protein
MKIKLALGLLAVLLLMTGNALAMSSTNYRLDWYTPLTSGGGGGGASSNYSANFTIGQSAIGQGASTNYSAGLGFWYGLLEWYWVRLPLVLRNYP